MRPGLQQSTGLRQELKVNPRLYQAMDLLHMPHEFTQALCNVSHDLVGIIGSDFLHALLFGNDLLLLLFGWVWPKHSSDFVDDLFNVTGSILNVFVCCNALLDSAECA